MRYTMQGITEQQWQDTKTGYTEWLEGIKIPSDVGTNDIKRLNAELDAIFTEVRMNFTYVEFQYERYMRMLKHAKTTLYLTFKDAGKTEKEREALVYEFLENQPLPGHPAPIMKLIDILEERYLFFKGLIEAIKEKSAKLITDSSALKIEANL